MFFVFAPPPLPRSSRADASELVPSASAAAGGAGGHGGGCERLRESRRRAALQQDREVRGSTQRGAPPGHGGPRDRLGDGHGVENLLREDAHRR
eukprot:2073797-Pyramimonas_sp.AAC.1